MSHTFRHPCGCKSKGDEWVHLCEPCRAEFDERHRQALADQRAREEERQSPPASQVNHV